MSLYNNQKQETLFHLHDPIAASIADCDPIRKDFTDFKCEKSYVLAERTTEYNCIGWAIGVKKFIDPTRYINLHYSQKEEHDTLVSTTGRSNPVTLHKYISNIESCKKAVTLFFEEQKDSSILPKKDKYVATDKIPNTPLDDTIAFYFKEGQDQVVGRDITIKGFQHAARYVKDVNSWVSDVWTSKLGEYKLMTHEEHELDGDIYGYILCYLVPMDRNTFECPNNINYPFETIADTCPV